MSRGTKYVQYRMLIQTVVTVDSIEVGYVVYILTHPPLKLVFQECTRRVTEPNAQTRTRCIEPRKHAVSAAGAVIIHIYSQDIPTTIVRLSILLLGIFLAILLTYLTLYYLLDTIYIYTQYSYIFTYLVSNIFLLDIFYFLNFYQILSIYILSIPILLLIQRLIYSYQILLIFYLQCLIYFILVVYIYNLC